MPSEGYIGFPAPLLGNEHLRLRVHHFNAGVLVLEKPVGVTAEAHPWYPHVPKLSQALRLQTHVDKPELRKYAIEQLKAVFFLEPELSGAAMFSTNQDTTAHLRNLFGSNAIGFSFTLVTEHRADLAHELCCDLPIASHQTLSRALISHKTGKKCETHFKLQQRLGNFSIWKAHSTFLRPHQIRLHAHEVGLAVLGERVYRSVNVPSLKQLKRGGRRTELETPLYAGVCAHLDCLEWHNRKGDVCLVSIPKPRKLSVLLKQMQKYLY